MSSKKKLAPSLVQLSALLAALPLLGGCGAQEDATPQAEAEAEAEPETAAVVAPKPERPAPVAAKPPAGVDLPPDDPILGKPLVLNSEVIPFEEVRRRIVFGKRGGDVIEMERIRIFIEEEIARQTAGGGDAARYEVSEEDKDAIVENVQQAIREEYEGQAVDPTDFIRASTMDELRDQASVESQFRKVFFAEDPTNFPLVTVEALNVDEEGKALLDTLQKRWSQHAAAHEQEGHEHSALGDRMLDSLLYDKIVSYLESTAVIEELGLPADVALRVNGRDITVDYVWGKIKQYITPPEVHEAKMWVSKMKLIEASLAEAGVWLTPEEAATTYAAHSDPYKDSMFSQETLALMFKKFPTLSSYKEYRRVYDSMYHYFDKDMTDEVLARQSEERTKKLTGEVTVDVDVILVAAFDLKRAQWLDDGWARAEARAKEVLTELVEKGRPWDDVLDEYSDFYDPPTPKSLEGLQQPGSTNRGRFRNKPRNQLMSLLGESEYWLFVGDSNITDYIFFDQEVGKIEQPIRGPLGYYIPKLIVRNKRPDRAPRDLEGYQDLVRQDYVQTQMRSYIQDLVAKSDIYGL